MKPILGSLAVLALLLLVIAPSFAVMSPIPAASGGDRVALAHTAAASEAPLCSASAATLDLSGPHCCGSGAGAACRDLCKQQGPGCKGSIGCRAGECVCTCNCP